MRSHTQCDIIMHESRPASQLTMALHELYERQGTADCANDSAASAKPQRRAHTATAHNQEQDAVHRLTQISKRQAM
jgi:hypothetical protein